MAKKRATTTMRVFSPPHSATDGVKTDDKAMDSLKMNLILSPGAEYSGHPGTTIIGDQMVAGAIPYQELEGWVKNSWQSRWFGKLRRWLRELIILLLLAGALIAGMDYLRRPALPQEPDDDTRCGRWRVTWSIYAYEPAASAALIYVLGCNGVPRCVVATTPSMRRWQQQHGNA